MFKKLTFLLPLFILFSACSKKGSDSNSSPDAPNTVSISGKAYSTVTIGSQVWTTVNYSGAGGLAVGAAYDEATYGKYYTPAEASAIPLPAGWRIPTKADFDKLLTSFATGFMVLGDSRGDKAVSTPLRSKLGWANNAGTNASGFNAYAAGYYVDDLNKSLGQGAVTCFLSSTAGGAGRDAGYYALQINDSDTGGGVYCGVYIYVSGFRTSIRFVKDK